MAESTSEQRENWKAYECQAGKMTRVQFGPDSILVAPPTVDAWAALATVLSGHGYVIRTPDTDSYNCRAITGGSGRSLHSFGIALDINWDTNPYRETPDQRAVKFSNKATQGERGDDVRRGRADTDMTPAMIADVLAIKTKAGKRVFEWGGNWKSVKDTMHFEIDVSPTDLASGIDPKTIGGGAPPAPVVTRPILKRGSIGEQVKLVQAALMLDGIFGPDTESAVRRFQRYRGLDDDGIIGPLTWRALEDRYPELKEAVEEPTTVEGWQTGITATVFGGSSETQKSAYDGHKITDAEYGVALPHRFSGQRPKVQLHNIATNKSVNAEIVDVGPWMEDDDYWTRGERPLAERYYRDKLKLPRGPNAGHIPSNPAGIDLTPASAAALGIDGSGKINWRFT